jgi:hypothetical protein
MRSILMGSVGLSLALFLSAARADQPVCYAITTGPSEAASSGVPIATLGRPIPLAAPTSVDAQVRTVSYSDPAPIPPSGVVRMQGSELPPPPLAVPPPAPPGIAGTPAEQYNCGVATQPPPGTGFWDGTKRLFSGFPWIGTGGALDNGAHHLFESDHSFDGFISPVTNPFYFEDPRSLTEIRPIFIYQGTPSRNPIFHGGDIEFFGVQGRLAITEQLSVVVNELGFISSEPHNGTPDFQPHTGFAELKIGPKFTFFRCDSTGTVAAAGLTFDIPAGPSRVQQNTGNLSLVPYLSAAQRLVHTPYGTLNGMGTLGYNFATDNQRSDNFFLSLHLDYDVGDLHRIYPLVELNWFAYTGNGKARNLNFEGGDLFNFGSTSVSGSNEVSLAVGARFKINDRLSVGAAYETPLTVHNKIEDFRITADLIFRY